MVGLRLKTSHEFSWHNADVGDVDGISNERFLILLVENPERFIHQNDYSIDCTRMFIPEVALQCP